MTRSAWVSRTFTDEERGLTFIGLLKLGLGWQIGHDVHCGEQLLNMVCCKGYSVSCQIDREQSIDGDHLHLQRAEYAKSYVCFGRFVGRGAKEEVVDNDQALGIQSSKEGLSSCKRCFEKQGCVATGEAGTVPEAMESWWAVGKGEELR